jgi:molybdenum cofactor cytidylyltransferase
MSSLKIMGIMLAAGGSRRMGNHKLSLPLGSSNIGSISLTSAIQSMLDHILVVHQKQDSLDWMDARLKNTDIKSRWTACISENSALGQAYSLKAGIKAANKVEADAVVLLLGDQPFLPPIMVNELILTYREALEHGKSPDFVAVEYDGLKRPPALFPKHVFRRLLELSGDQGARQLIRNNRNSGMAIPCEDQLAFFDIDTKEDYQQALKEGRKLSV